MITRRDFLKLPAYSYLLRVIPIEYKPLDFIDLYGTHYLLADDFGFDYMYDALKPRHRWVHPDVTKAGYRNLVLFGMPFVTKPINGGVNRTKEFKPHMLALLEKLR